MIEINHIYYNNKFWHSYEFTITTKKKHYIYLTNIPRVLNKGSLSSCLSKNNVSLKGFQVLTWV